MFEKEWNMKCKESWGIFISFPTTVGDSCPNVTMNDFIPYWQSQNMIVTSLKEDVYLSYFLVFSVQTRQVKQIELFISSIKLYTLPLSINVLRSRRTKTKINECLRKIEDL